MLFNSLGYILLLLIVIPLHWLLPHRFRLGVLASFSILFYCMWRWEFALLMIFSAIVDYVAASRIHKEKKLVVRKFWLLTSLTINIGLLIVFKYTYFIYDNINLVVGPVSGSTFPALQDLGIRLILPLGISFYTFQTISYTIDVYRKIIKPTQSFITFLTYVTFWPQLIAGPILRAREVIPQLVAPRTLKKDDLISGIIRVLIGLFKKVVIADNIAPIVDSAFSMDPLLLTGIDVWVMAFLFGFQIYFDFAGYSDVAIGSARMLGIHFPENFNWPYLAQSPKDFWKRWHISLSSWIRDYLYLPLTRQKFRDDSTGGISVATETKGYKRYQALFITWFIMGLWHGAGWNFVIWGLYHATLIFIYRTIKPLDNITHKMPIVSWAMMLFFSMMGWIAFRAESLAQTGIMFTKIINPMEYGLSMRALDPYSYLSVAFITIGMLSIAGLKKQWRIKVSILRQRTVNIVHNFSVVILLAAMSFAIFVYLRPIRQFIYFQF